MPFLDFYLLSITSLISYLNSIKNLQVGSIRGYLSGIQFFNKLIHGSVSPKINDAQTSLLIKGILRSQPTPMDSRKSITLDILTKCISTLSLGYQSTNTARTLDAMYISAFFVFLRCSELAITSNFNPMPILQFRIYQFLDSETIYFISLNKAKQKKSISSISSISCHLFTYSFVSYLTFTSETYRLNTHLTHFSWMTPTALSCTFVS